MTEAVQGCLEKMGSHLNADPGKPVDYQMVIGEQKVDLNPSLGKTIELKFSGNIFCCHCGRKTNKSFSQGFCFPCFKKLARCDSCIMSPEKCHYYEGTCREPEWGETYCMVPHVVYLANSSGLKVGITRQTQIPTRWIDQGAAQALPIFQVHNRRMSGLVEDLFRSELNDRTHWQAMLKGEPEPLNLAAERERLYGLFDQRVSHLIQTEQGAEVTKLLDTEMVEIAYPVLEYPVKVKSINPEKTPEIGGTLLGIKGQYLILDTGVINIRKFTAYEAEFRAIL
ncbi:hypothetical protein BTA51_09515 [Hahella sp. CCB-MM4]|uniref:DUF2797 domain-containing protein n=1 Tax=Hahella sp. (strain CCB-MM4) TaxID=1926491 RepID=UPI000B9BA52B|nr:DUF2797 domain-containing protein [Hahella sp. CCB-MM4]OZG74007.1 hypothetical protein BTA51_09515 [Hahella sp. CCB-MM4]